MKATRILYYISLITLSGLFTFSSKVFCQNVNGNCTNSTNDTSVYEEIITGEFYVPNQFHQGPNFYNPDWRYGTIVFEDGKKVYHKLINFHYMTGDLFWMRQKDYKQIIVSKTTVKEFIIYSNDTSNRVLFRKTNFQPWYKPNPISEYLQVLSQGYMTLYAYRKATVDKNTNQIIPATEYYVQFNNGELQHLKRGRWPLYRLTAENKMIMKKIVRSNHYRIRKEENLIKSIILFNKEIKNLKN
jgi:hypothetical protein